MNDIYTDVSVLLYLPNVICPECALRTMNAGGVSFSYHFVNRACLIYNTCHFRKPPISKTLEPSEGWRHFCSNINVTSRNGETWLDLGTLLVRRNSIRFDVKARNDVYFGLSSQNTSTGSGYLVLLGGWNDRASCLRDGFVYGSTCFSTYHGSVLSDTQYTKYWVTWMFGRIRVGFGETIGNRTFIDHTFPHVYPVNNLLLSSSEAGWIIYL
ncbi:uncharacterized protein LOC133196301 [Saccostrea echinata]|uniref:uncharacterized protein LOC133196301 n=1 Tax=Saccostrea echinata TaxID=191078 RepID=UPI002A81A64D|nr:uncharacterized protein LOC133196301 [Saccostrea echinata]